jgi:hypothetical protein
VPTFSPFAGYLLWEFAVTGLCLVWVASVRSLALKVPLLIALNITVSALCAMLLSFLYWNHAFTYLVVAGALAGTAVLIGWKRRAAVFSDLDWAPKRGMESALLWFLLGSLLVLAIRPVEEVDSLYNLHYVMAWVQNKSTPYEFAYHFVPFWELSYVPQLVLGRTDAFFWFQSLKPVALLGCLLFLIGQELDLPDALTIRVLPALMLFPHLWLGPTGVSTIKNDMIHACGAALAALVALRASRGRCRAIDVGFAALSALFLSIKFSGPVSMVLGGIVIGCTTHRWIRANWKTALTAAGAVGAVWFVGAGHFYLHNLLGYGNPVYPFALNLGPLHLPGTADLSATSILYNLRDERVWRYLFLPEGGLSPAGVLFPFMLAGILLGSPVVVGLAVWRRRLTPIAALALFQLVTWCVYLRSIYSASAGTEADLIFLANDLNSVRYVEGPLLIGKLCLFWALYRLRTPTGLILLLVALQAGTSWLVLSRRAPDQPWLLVLFGGVVLALLSQVMRQKVMVAGAVLLVGVSLLSGALLVERRRPQWLPSVQPLYTPLYDAAPAQLFYLITDEYSQQPCWHFPMLGRRLQHDAASGPLSRLSALTPRPKYVAWTRSAPDTEAIRLAGYSLVVETPLGRLFEASK